MKVQKLPMVALAAVAVVGSVFAHDCSCHVCPSGTYGINGAPNPFAVAGSSSVSGGMVDGETWTVGDIIWLEGGRYKSDNARFGGGFYAEGETRAGFNAADTGVFSFLLDPVTVNVTGTVLQDIREGCFCTSGGMEDFTSGSQTVGSMSRTWLTGSTSSASCGAGTAQSDFSIVYDQSGIGRSANSFGNSGGGSPQTGFSRASDGDLDSFSGQLALFGTICEACPTPEPTNVPTGSPTQAPSQAPTVSPTPAPTGVPSLSPTPRPTSSPTGVKEDPPAFFEEEQNIFIVAGAGGGFLLLLLLLGLTRSRRKSKETALMAAPADIEEPKTRKARGNAPDPKTSQSIRLEIDDEIFDWEKHIDKSSGEVYFFNPKTGESRWDPPTIKKKT